MTYQAFYRVYRPQSFREMSGQSHVKRTLQNALLASKTTHAYLFSGPRGTGKTSTAKIFAKALNCEAAPAAEPCNECPTCVSITEGSHTDVIEFDAASNSRVEEMREIIEKVRFAPASARFKVYIIDEVHMLSTSAFNALLKTLEEPPEHAVFILATTEPHKLPATIISRCQRFDFKRLSTIDILNRMKVVLEDIQLPYDEQALKVIAQAAAGGMRDALSLLDQVVSFSGEKVELEDALLVTGSVSQDVFLQITHSLQNRDVASVLAAVDGLIADGKEPLRLAEDFITFFRDLLLLQSEGDLNDLLQLITPSEQFVDVAREIPTDTLYNYIDILAKTQQEMRFSHHTKIYLETALLKMAQNVSSTAVAAIDPAVEMKVGVLEKTMRDLMKQVSTGQVGVQQAVPQAPKKRSQPKSSNSFKAPTGRITEVLKSATKEDVQKIKAVWAQSLAPLQKSQVALLNDAEPVAASSNAFVVKFKYDIHCQMVAENYEFNQMFTQTLASLIGTPYEMLCIPENQWFELREQFIREKGMGQGAADPVAEAVSVTDADDTMQLVEEDPLVAEAEGLFGKEFVEVIEE
ncbi:MAG: DNA polymerase III subunit gamma/tau [Lysinibacillus sp.]